MKRTCLGLFAFLALIAVPVCAFAAEDVAGEAPAAKSQDGGKAPKYSEPEITDPVVKEKQSALNKKYVSIMANLDSQEVQHFAVVIVNYNLISTVRAVQDDVSMAVSGCAEKNPEIAESVNNRFSKWQEAVGKSMQEAVSNVNNLVLAQTYVEKTEYESLFALIDDVRKYNSSRFEKTPVTTPEACEYMLSKMDETQEQMVGMLAATLQSLPAVRDKAQE